MLSYDYPGSSRIRGVARYKEPGNPNPNRVRLVADVSTWTSVRYGLSFFGRSTLTTTESRGYFMTGRKDHHKIISM